MIASAFALLAIVEAATAVVAPRRVATEADWSATAAEVRAGFRPGDLIVFAPRWTDPIGRFHLGDLVTPEMAGRVYQFLREKWCARDRATVLVEHELCDFPARATFHVAPEICTVP